MNTVSKPDIEGGLGTTGKSFPVFVIAALAIAHLLLFIYDQYHPNVFLNADRAAPRFGTIKDFVALFPSNWSTISQFLATHGNIGDYAVQGGLYALGGETLIIIVQCILFILSVISLYKLCCLLTHSTRVAMTAIVIFALLPHSIFFPHVLSSEAFFIPLVIFGFYYYARFCFEAPVGSYLVLAGIAFGLAALVRPLIFPWPILICIALLIGGCSRPNVLRFAIFSFGPMLLWMAFIWSQTGQFNEGRSERDLIHNLYWRVSIIADTLPADEKAEVDRDYLSNPEQTATITQYLAFCARYPSPCLSHLAADAASFVGKSGIERLSVEYLELMGKPATTGDTRYSFQDKHTGWRQVLQTKGVIAMIWSFLEVSPTVVILAALGLVGIIVLWILAAIGAWAALMKVRKSPALEQGFVVLLVIFPFYIFSVSQFVDLMQSRHRAPAEFVLCIFAAFALQQRSARRIGANTTAYSNTGQDVRSSAALRTVLSGTLNFAQLGEARVR